MTEKKQFTHDEEHWVQLYLDTARRMARENNLITDESKPDLDCLVVCALMITLAIESSCK